MAKNRLQLDFSLSTTQERSDFINNYINKYDFTEAELEMMANYILWGKDENGLNVVQKGEIEIETRNKTWTKKAPESLDALLETPTFNENTIASSDVPQTKQTRIVFDRKLELSRCPEHLVGTYENLFDEIDRIDLLINFYDLDHGKRKNPPRAELLNRFSEEEASAIHERSTHLNAYKYLKYRHLLVDLRKEQFALKDTYCTPVLMENQRPQIDEPSSLVFDSDIPVLPCGLYYLDNKQQSVFSPIDRLLPQNFSEKEIEEICKAYWKRQKKANAELVIDFRDLEHVYNLFMQFFDLADSSQLDELDSTTQALLNTLNYYIDLADLTDVQQDILELKKNKVRNQDIAYEINKKYNKTYTANYISTIFRQKIIKQINEAALYHERIIQSLPFPENFKVCSTCGAMLLRDPQNFVRKTRAKDGYTGRCKKCDKKDREKKKSTTKGV